MQPYAHILKGQPYSEFNPVCTPLRLLTDQGLKSYQQHNTHRDYDAQPLSLKTPIDNCHHKPVSAFQMLNPHETSTDSAAKFTMIASRLTNNHGHDLNLNDLVNCEASPQQHNQLVENPFDNKENSSQLLNSATFNTSIVSKKPAEVVLQKPV